MDPKQLPCVVVGWDAEEQKAMLQFDQKAFKTWDMVIAVLDMAKAEAENQRRLRQLQRLQAEAQRQAEVQTEAKRQIQQVNSRIINGG